jgi:PEGA domain
MNIQTVTRTNLLDSLSCPYKACTLESAWCSVRRFAKAAILCVGLLSAEQSFCQAGTARPQSGVGHADQATCLILKRTGAVDQVTSRVLSFGIHGKQFQYIEGKLPEGFSFHDKLSEHDVRNLQVRGSEVIILSSDYMPDELQQAREDCRAATRKPTVQADTAQIEIASTPPGTDIELDGKFIGSTPSSVKVPSGEHTVKLSKNGYSPWERRITTLAGTVRISPELQVLPTTAAA